MTSVWIQIAFYLIILIVLAVLLGNYIGKVMNGEKVFLSRLLTPVEKGIYKLLRVNVTDEMNWKKYAVSVLVFSGIFFILLFGIQVLQGVLPLNPEGLKNVRWDLAFNTTSSFVTNTNWQAYLGESTLSYFTQMMGLTVQNFVSAAVGIAVLFALIRGFVKVQKQGLGNFYQDVTRISVVSKELPCLCFT